MHAVSVPAVGCTFVRVAKKSIRIRVLIAGLLCCLAQSAVLVA